MNIYEMWHMVEDTDLRLIVEKGDNVLFNGEEFSDDYCFDVGEAYEVLDVTPASMVLKTKFTEGETKVEVHIDGLSSFHCTVKL